METAGEGSVADAVPVGSRLRVLGLFGLPEGGQALNLRRERHGLVRLVNRIAARGKAAEVFVLQNGVTRDRLRGVLEEAEAGTSSTSPATVLPASCCWRRPPACWTRSPPPNCRTCSLQPASREAGNGLRVLVGDRDRR